MADRVLVVDDEQAILDLLEFILQDGGYEVRCATRGDTALEICSHWLPDLVILDIGLPGVDGLEVCRRLHAESVPVLVLSSHDRDDQVVEGLEEGAEDYVTKPFNHRELLLRVEKLLNRAGRREANATSTASAGDTGTGAAAVRYKIGDLLFDPALAEVTCRGRSSFLTPTESRILELLARNPGRPVDMETILTEVWNNPDWEGGAEMVKVNIRRLRRKIEPDPANPVYLLNRRGLGYFLAEQ